jgi:hypothetical protein
MTNFDKFQDHDEAIKCFELHCAQHPWCENCPHYIGMRLGDSVPMLKCFFKWLKAEYTDKVEPKWLKELSDRRYKNIIKNEEENDGR